jgi:hypothetical protein
MGILYSDGDAAGALIAKEQPAPAFVIRPGKPRSSRRSKWVKVALDTPFYDLITDDAIAPTTPPFSYQPPIQHRANPNSINNDLTTIPQSLPPINNDLTTIPQSLPPTSASLESITESPEFFDPLSSPSTGDWTFVHHAAQHTAASSAPPTEPETWILLGDDS